MTNSNIVPLFSRPLVVRPQEAARLIGVSTPQFYRMLRSGELDITCVRISKGARGFRVADLEAWASKLEA